MLGDDWAPEGYELWRNDTARWELHPETDPDLAVDRRPAPPRRVHRGRRREPVTRPEHAYHALEIMLAAQAAGADGRARDITSDFPAPDYARARRGRRPPADPRPAERVVTPRRAMPPPASSPRPTFDGPAAIPCADVTRHVWGDAEAGEVADWIYASTEHDPLLVFGLAPGGAFRHSREFRTVFGADEVLHVLEGTLVIANPETRRGAARRGGRERLLPRATPGTTPSRSGGEPLRVLELFAPPPAAGASGAYARTQPYLETSRYADDALLGALAARRAARAARCASLRAADVVCRRDLGALVGLLASTEHLTAATLEIGPGEVGRAARPRRRRGADGARRPALRARLARRRRRTCSSSSADDACYLPAGAPPRVPQLRAAGTARAIFGVAPSYLP